MNAYKITFDDGNIVYATMNATLAEAKEYYLNNVFNFGDTDAKPYDDEHRGVLVEQLGITNKMEEGE